MEDKIKKYNDFFVGKILAFKHKNSNPENYIILKIRPVPEDGYELKKYGRIYFDGYDLTYKEIVYSSTARMTELDKLMSDGKYEDSVLTSEII